MIFLYENRKFIIVGGGSNGGLVNHTVQIFHSDKPQSVNIIFTQYYICYQIFIQRLSDLCSWLASYIICCDVL